MSSQPQSDDDDDEVSVVLATASLPNPPMTLDEKRQELMEVHRLIRAKYDAGIPFFTKDLFRGVVQQLESDSSERVSITGLDGFAVDFPIEPGKEYQYHPYGHGYFCVKTKPRLAYQTIQRLLAIEDPNQYSVYRAYLPVELVHATEVRNIQTHELVGGWPAADYATVSLRFEQAKRSLEASEHFGQLKSTLSSLAVAVPPGINKIIALSCSTMTWADDHYMRSMAQHILALTIRDVLATRYTTGAHVIKCYAQDPIYTPVDTRVLSEAGFTVVDDPRAFLEVDEASVIIAIDPDIPVRQIIADIARPAIMIWNKVAPAPDGDVFFADPVSPRVTQMVGEYIELPFQVDDKYFGDLALYVRKEA